MKKLAIPALIAVSLMTFSCNDKTADKLKDSEAENAELQSEVAAQKAMQDSLLVLFNEISDGMNQIKDLEKIISSPVNLSSESQERKDQIKNDMMAIQRSLQERRQRLEQLEAQLGRSQSENATLLKTIENLKAQIADQQTEIATLTNQLASANITIQNLGTQVTQLNTRVDSLNTGISEAREAERAAAAEAKRADAEANAVYYIIGTDKELKSKGVLKGGGFLRGSKMGSDFNKAYFIQADRRHFNSIPTHAKKAEVKSAQPKDSYKFVDVDGNKVLQIINPARFWATTNVLVIKIN